MMNLVCSLVSLNIFRTAVKLCSMLQLHNHLNSLQDLALCQWVLFIMHLSVLDYFVLNFCYQSLYDISLIQKQRPDISTHHDKYLFLHKLILSCIVHACCFVLLKHGDVGLVK